jgi:hypothetical protein
MVVEETGRVESCRDLEFWDRKQNDTGRVTIYMFKNINSSY